jgi:hypothetical protein
MRARCRGSLVSSARRNTDRPSSGLRDHGVCLFGPRVRFPDDTTDRSYATLLTMTIARLRARAAHDPRRLATILQDLAMVAIAAYPSNRIVRATWWRRDRGRRARVEHAIARVKHRVHYAISRGTQLQRAMLAITFLHNLHINLRDIF